VCFLFGGASTLTVGADLNDVCGTARMRQGLEDVRELSVVGAARVDAVSHVKWLSEWVGTAAHARSRSAALNGRAVIFQDETVVGVVLWVNSVVEANNRE
jgi:hypothetical protein